MHLSDNEENEVSTRPAISIKRRTTFHKSLNINIAYDIDNSGHPGLWKA